MPNHDPRCHVCYDVGCEFCPRTSLEPACIVCGKTIEPALVRLGSIRCSEHRMVRKLILASLGGRAW